MGSAPLAIGAGEIDAVAVPRQRRVDAGLYHRRARRGAVAAPELDLRTLAVFVGGGQADGEEEGVANCGEVEPGMKGLALRMVGGAIEEAAGAGQEIGHHAGAGGGAVAAPQLEAGGAVGGDEVEDMAGDGELRPVAAELVVGEEEGAAAAAMNVAHPAGAGGGAVAAPQLGAGLGILGDEVQHAVEDRGARPVVEARQAAAGAGHDVEHHAGAGGGAVAVLQLATGIGGAGTEQ